MSERVTHPSKIKSLVSCFPFLSDAKPNGDVMTKQHSNRTLRRQRRPRKTALLVPLFGELTSGSQNDAYFEVADLFCQDVSLCGTGKHKSERAACLGVDFSLI